MAKFTFMNGREMKTIDPWHSEGTMWKYDNAEANDNELYSRVAAVYRAVNFTADTLSNMPFSIMNQRGDDIDTSDEYTNAVGFLPYPRSLFRLMVQSLIVTNSAYCFQETKGSKTTNLRYIAPSTITPKTDTQTGALKSFIRTLGTTRTEYPIDAKGFCNIVYVFNLNWKNELLPDGDSPFKAMCNAAGIGYYADTFIKDFFARGGIKPTILTFDGVMDATSAERVESVWTKVIRGWYKYMGKVFNGKFLPVTIGEGVESLKEQSIYDNALRNIAIAVGMPQDALLQNADSYATAQVHKSTWFSDTLTPLAMLMAEPLNEQVFKRLGYTFEFRPDGAEPNMEEESSRVNAAKTLYDILSAGNRVDADKAAVEALGIDLPAWFTWEEKEEEPEPMEQAEEAAEPEEDDEEEAEPVAKSVFTVDQLREMKNWQDIAFRKLKRGNSLVFDWTPKDIPAEIAEQIKAKLDNATTEDEIRAAFEIDTMNMPVMTTNSSEIKLLADAINKLAETQAQP